MRQAKLGSSFDRLSPRLFGILLALPAVLALGLIVVFPLGYNIVLSFCRISPALGARMTFVGLTNYTGIFADPSFWNALRNTMIITIAAVAFEMVFGLVMALILNMDLKYGGVIRTLLMAPIMIAPVVVALQWRWMFADQYGVINYFMSILGLSGVRWLAQPGTAFASIVWVDIWQTTPFVMMILLAGLQSLPTEPFEAAYVDGASGFQVFRRLTLPLLKPVVLVTLIIRTTDVFRIFDTVYLLTGGGPGTSTEVLGTFTYRQTFSFLNFGRGSALSIISLLVSGVIGLLYVRMLGGRKES